MNDQWCLCWSQAQNAFHIEPLEDHLTNNRRAYRENLAGDYRVLHIGTREMVDSLAINAGGTLVSRQPIEQVMHEHA